MGQRIDGTWCCGLCGAVIPPLGRRGRPAEYCRPRAGEERSACSRAARARRDLERALADVVDWTPERAGVEAKALDALSKRIKRASGLL